MPKKKKSSTDHLHKYKKVDIGRKSPYIVFKCELANCIHYIPLIMAMGKVCACNRCGMPITLDKESIQLVRPHCKDCKKSKKENVIDHSLSELLDKIIP